MADLVAEAAGGHVRPLHLKPLAVPVLGPDLYPVGPHHIAPHAGQGQAALPAGLLPPLVQNFRVDHLQHALVLQQHNSRPAEDTHLRGRQPHDVSLGQGLLQIVQQVGQLVIETGDRVAHLIQRGVVLGQNRPDCHTYFSFGRFLSVSLRDFGDRPIFSCYMGPHLHRRRRLYFLYPSEPPEADMPAGYETPCPAGR